MFNFLTIKNKNKKLVKISCVNNFTYVGLSPDLSIYAMRILDVNYTGKTYKWSLKPSFWKLTFNRSHPTWLFFKVRVFMKRFTKNKIRLFFVGNSADTVLMYLHKTRRYNIFTQRGLKVKGTYIFKKRGKISTYR